MNGCGSSPSIASPVTGSVLSSSALTVGQVRFRPAPRASAASHRREPDRCSAAPAAWPGLSSSRLRKVSAAMSGLSRSGSENMTSKAITTAPSLVRLVTRSAIRVRGHGHWPNFARLFSSISTMVTGRAFFTARVDALEGIEGPDPKLLDRRGIGDAQRREADQQRQAHQPRIAELPREPASQYPQSLHAVWISGSGGLITPAMELATGQSLLRSQGDGSSSLCGGQGRD